MIDLKNTNILFLSVSFFQYEIAIARRLRELGACVDFYDERPSNSNLSKGIIRFNKKWYQYKIDAYYNKIITEIKNKKYHYFLLIKGEAIPTYFIEKVKELNPEITTIYYNFDSLEEYPNLVSHFKYFDKNFTFDRKDAQKYNLHFRPLFYLDEYQNQKSNNEIKKYDISFIGSAHTDRYLVGEKVRNIAEKLELNCYFYYYAMGKISFKLKKFFDKNLQHFDAQKISYQKLNHEQIIKIYLQSKAILDINKPFQNGLTIRTFEVLALGKKLITTNTDIVNYPFYNPQNILVINRENIELPKEFFYSEFQEIDKETLSMMSLDSFIECLFIKNQDDYWQ